MTRLARIVLGLVALSAVLAMPARAAEEVDLLLVLASDVSRSVDTRKFQLQREGYAAALSNPRVVEAIQSGPHGKIAICFVEWSGATSLKLVIDWTIVGDAASARKIGDQMLELPRSFADRTSISAGLEFALAQLERAPFKARAPHHRRLGRRHQQFRARHRARCATRCSPKGVTINGLVILSDSPLPWNPEHTNPPGGLGEYYRKQRDRRSGRLRHGGGEPQFVRPGDREEDDRRDRVGAAGAAGGDALARSASKSVHPRRARSRLCHRPRRDAADAAVRLAALAPAHRRRRRDQAREPYADRRLQGARRASSMRIG